MLLVPFATLEQKGDLMHEEDRLDKFERKAQRWKEERLEKDSERFRVVQGVFDESTLMVLYKFLNKGVLEELFGTINSGKEANVYYGKAPNGDEYAVKVYRTVASVFKRINEYIAGDRRFKRYKKNSYAIIYTWARKEFSNLKRMEKAGMPVPKPIEVEKNVLIMGFLGRDGLAFPLIRETEVENPDKQYKSIIDDIKKLYEEAGLVHGDLSEYNLMFDPDEQQYYVIDVSQAVLTSNPRADLYLYRDLTNVNNYFEGLGVTTISRDTLFKQITGRKPSPALALDVEGN